jgi:hypothetical protein
MIPTRSIRILSVEHHPVFCEGVAAIIGLEKTPTSHCINLRLRSGVSLSKELQLSTKYRVVVMLRDVERLSTLEVALQLGLTVSTVKTRLLRGRLVLRELLSPYFSENVERIDR